MHVIVPNVHLNIHTLCTQSQAGLLEGTSTVLMLTLLTSYHLMCTLFLHSNVSTDDLAEAIERELYQATDPQQLKSKCPIARQSTTASTKYI